MFGFLCRGTLVENYCLRWIINLTTVTRQSLKVDNSLTKPNFSEIFIQSKFNWFSRKITLESKRVTIRSRWWLFFLMFFFPAAFFHSKKYKALTRNEIEIYFDNFFSPSHNVRWKIRGTYSSDFHNKNAFLSFSCSMLNIIFFFYMFRSLLLLYLWTVLTVFSRLRFSARWRKIIIESTLFCEMNVRTKIRCEYHFLLKFIYRWSDGPR